MEKEQSTSGMLDSSQMKSLEQRKPTESHDFNDVMYRRMKNRERQRRYRARKRLEADTKSSHTNITEPAPLPVELQLNGKLNSCVTQTPLPVELQLNGKLNSCVTQTPLPVKLQLNGKLNSCMTHVHRRRDWKKDARRAHEASKDKEDRSSGSFSPAQTVTNESQVPCLSSGAKVESLVQRDLQSHSSLGVIKCETQKTIPFRRDWKAAARNKKSVNG